MEKRTPEQMMKENIMPVAVVSTVSYKTQFNARQFPVRGEVNKEPSVTTPDLSLSVKELVYRYTHGQSLGASRTPVYDSEMEIPYPANWNSLDLSEKHDWIAEKTAEYNALQERLEIEANTMLEEKRKKEIEEAVNKKLKTIRENRRGTSNAEELTVIDETPQ